MSENEIQRLIDHLAEKQDLTLEQSSRAFQIMLAGGATPAQMGAFLMGLRVKGETTAEITGGAQMLRAKSGRINAPEGSIDTCGTGGDSRYTLNVSTAAAIVVAACGVPVAKHGNRSITSKSGSADVLAAIGVNINASPATVELCLWDCGICFMMAPRFHTAMRHIAPVRQELAMRSIFNLLGPLANPAQPKRQLLGVYGAQWVTPMAKVLQSLEEERAWVVHGDDGVDELSITGPSRVAELKDGAITELEITPEDAGLNIGKPEYLQGGDAHFNAHAIHDLLNGEEGVYRDIVLLNSAAALVISDQARDLREGVEQAREAIDSRKAKETLARLVYLSHQSGEEE